MRISSYSLGCKVNYYENEAVIQTFLKHDFTLVPFTKEADVVIINTCSITEVGDAKSRKIIRQAIRRSPAAVIVVMGCYSQLASDDIIKIDGVDIIIGTSYRDQIYPMVLEFMENKKQIIKIKDMTKFSPYEEMKISRYTNKTRGFVKIQDGCDNFCSYCVIPYARGRIRSRKAIDVINEIKALTCDGVKEIVLTGINTGTYGKDLGSYNLVSLLKDLINEIPHLPRIRISSIELSEVSIDLINLMKDNPDVFCQHLHIPLQGGVDNTLQRMNRLYTINDYKTKIQMIRDIFPKINITSDVLIGFSGESDEDFSASKKNIIDLAFGEMHVFPYSRRPLTKAFNYPNRVNSKIKHERVKEILAINDRLALAYRESFIGEVVKIIVEKNDNNTFYGLSSEYIAVSGKGKVELNALIEVKITKAKYPICEGELI